MSSSWSGPQPSMAPALCTSAYSSLHQERLYLLEALAVEESRGEQLTRALETTRTKLKHEEGLHKSSETIKNLKKLIRSICFKLSRCQKTERCLTENLAAVVQSMVRLQQNQWRMAHANYQQQMQHGLLESPALPWQDSLSPMTHGLVHGVQGPSVVSPAIHRFNCVQPVQNLQISRMMPVMPNTPFLQPQRTVSSYHQPSNLWMHSPNAKIGPYYLAHQELSLTSDNFLSLSLGSWTFPQQDSAIEQVTAKKPDSIPDIMPKTRYVDCVQERFETIEAQSKPEETIPSGLLEMGRKLSSMGFGIAAIRLRKKAQRLQHSA